MSGKLRVTLRRSTVGTNPSARGTVRALGLRRIGHTVELTDDDAVRGQVRTVRYLVDVEEVAAKPEAKKEAPKKVAAGKEAPTEEAPKEAAVKKEAARKTAGAGKAASRKAAPKKKTDAKEEAKA